ncbi:MULTISPECIES: glycoside hydrolase family 9 protein [unclassified Micromonospora]|uniref:glycoside hydrolase family 9 protein n=1 Tax=unclassified Micromonospora TaxID=2617518 RepID=UPI003A8C657D
MSILSRRRTVPLAVTAVTALTATALTAAVPAHAQDEAPEQIVNGTFDDGHAPWWGTPNITLDSSSQQLCADIPGGTVNPWDVIIGQDNVPLVAGETYEYKFFATATPNKVIRALIQLPVDPWTQFMAANPEVSVSGNNYTYTFTAPTDLPDAQVAFQVGGSADPWRLCLDDVSLRGGAEPEEYVPDTGPRVRVNQVGYLPKGPKNATLVTDATDPLPWKLYDSGGKVVVNGKTKPHGLDESSGQNVHSITFSRFVRPGTGYTLVADGETSFPFEIGTSFYTQLRADALKFYYTQRSGIEISDELRPGYGRPAGHVGVAPNQGDLAVPCQPGVCDYTLDVSGGWYDAGDHGKYVVNGGISVYQLMNEYERALRVHRGKPWLQRDGVLDLPESGNKLPDILDEVRWQQEFLLKMQVPAGQPLAGMAHHKIHDAAWTGLPLLPHLDSQLRELHPPSTAATLNLAATAAQAARVFKPYDEAFAGRNLDAARTAWAAAKANPQMYADPADAIGGGPYDDTDVTDEFYWAAAELYLTTGEREFRDFVLASPHHTGDIFQEGAFGWQWTAPLGRMALATTPNSLPGWWQVRASVIEAADRYLATLDAHPYGIPYAPVGNLYDWGSNSVIVNNAIVIATAYDLTGKEKYRDGVLQTMDYIFGRNALNISYVTGYGTVSSQNQHSRWYARQLNPELPNPPRGTLAGGPNSSIQDPVAQRLLTGCAPQFCYVDDIESWATNELTINWNAPLSWIAAFIADQGRG